MKNLLFLIPVYNDWKSLDLLLKKIDLELKKKNYFSEILIINDASTIKKRINIKNLFNIKNIFILNTKKNLGSQKCIHLGLKHINQFKKHGLSFPLLKQYLDLINSGKLHEYKLY